MFSILLYEYIIKLEIIKTVYNAIFSKKNSNYYYLLRIIFFILKIYRYIDYYLTRA